MDVAVYAAQAAAAKPMPLVSAPSPVEGLVAHVDGDFCAYFCAGNDDVDPGTARRILLNKLEKIKTATGATSVLVHLTDPASTKGERYLVATVKPYQGQRKSGRKPKNWAFLREYLAGYDGDKFRVKNWMTREADDGIAYLTSVSAAHGRLAVIATADKDMRMLPGRHLIWKTNQLVDVPQGTFELVGPDGNTYGTKFFWYQLLAGDNADHIPGLPKVVPKGAREKQMGPATAEAWLKPASNDAEAWELCASAYSSYYEDWADRIVEQMCLLWLRRDRHAGLLDFLRMVPKNESDVIEAAERLADRVAEARAVLDSIPCAG